MTKPDLVALAERLEFAAQNTEGCLYSQRKMLTEAAQALRHLASQPSLYEAGLRDMPLTSDQIKYMVDRFLMWRLPEHFNPDCGISFDTKYRSEHGPVGTNLFDAVQATAMVRHMIEGMAPALPADGGEVDARKITENVGRWLSAALDDPQVCQEMKDDILAWMNAGMPNVQPGPSEATPSTAGSVKPMEFFSKNVDRWGATEWFDRLAKAVHGQDAAVLAGDDITIETCRNVAASSAMRLVREFENEVRSALSAPVEAPVAVKPLEWGFNKVAGSALGKYIIDEWPGPYFTVDIPGRAYGNNRYSTIDAAKAAAQADYEQRIRSALIATPRPLPSVEQIAQIIDGNEYWTARTKATAILTLLGGSAHGR